MSKLVTKDNLLLGFPYSLSEDSLKRTLAEVVAEELAKLYSDNDILALYARIDELDEVMLDILAYDLKVDWWNSNYSVEEKRQTLKNAWNVHKRLGTPAAISTAVSAIYKSAKVQEWWEYGGCAFYFRLIIDTGNAYVDSDKLDGILERIRYYKNKRSLLETIKIDTGKNTCTYIGTALQSGCNSKLKVVEADLNNYNWLADENNIVLTDENGMVLFE